MASSVRILNPLPGTARRTSLKRAQRYVKQGRARFSECGKHIEFIGEDHRHQLVLMLVAAARQESFRTGEQARVYNRLSPLMRLDELRHIPCLRAEQAFTLTTRPRRNGYRNGTARSVLSQHTQHADAATPRE